MATHELTTAEIVEAIEAGKTVMIPCATHEEATNVKNNVTSRLYKMRSQISKTCDMQFQSVGTSIETAEDFSHVLVTFKLQERDRAVFKCTILEPEASNG